MRYLVAIFLLLSLIGCEKFFPASENTTKIKLHIDVPPDEVMIVRDNPYDFNYDYEVVAKAKLSKDFDFQFQFNLKEKDVFQLRTKENVIIERIYLYPGDELKVNIDNTNPEDLHIKFDGESAKANSFVQNIKSQYVKHQDYYDQLNNPNADVFNHYIDSLHNDMLSYFKEFFFKDSIPEVVKKMETANIDFEWAYAKIDWTIRNFYYNPQNWDKKIIPDNYYAFLNNLNLIEPYLSLFLTHYLESLIWDWHIKEVQKGVQPTEQNREMAKYQIAKQKFFGESADIAMTLCLNDLLMINFDERMMNVINNLLNDFRSSVKNKKYVEPIEKLYKQRISLLKGNPAPNFTLPNLFNAPISLNDFKGKVIYCYFWSMQYDPSIQMAKFLNRIQIENLRNPNIAFISVALEENNQEKWKNFIQGDTLTGAQLYAEGLFASKVAKDYMINTLPYAFIVDKKGNIGMMNAPFPTDSNLIETLIRFMKQ
ncbi:TlpA family protein disulfide reductase [Bacteroidetes/Chlorobi group bacterium ChocPot_Mid]|nr:MAG: TlpA family protein disulfide reductase [Bacteroidetes/Chlorobi group bacterium ChocPot_Mid]